MESTLSVSELTQAIKNLLEPNLHSIAVKGEITNFKEQSSGHIYFSLKDEKSQIQAALFRGYASKLRVKPKAGDSVIVRGEVSVYAPRGSYQIIVREIEFAGVGELLMLLHERKKKLEGLGWFAQERKKPLPKYPKTIGVVTSPTGSVIQDILNVLERRFKNFHLILCPVRVQGQEAAGEIAEAIRLMNAQTAVDVMIVGRGGGSLEDLWPFNEECVAEAIYHSHIPVISAVGHETDVTLADFVADRRAPTPSAAAEICMGERQEQLSRLSQAQDALLLALRRTIESAHQKLAKITAQPLLNSPYALLGPHMQRLDDGAQRLDMAINGRLRSHRVHLEGLFRTVQSLNPKKQIDRDRERLERYAKELGQIAKQQITRQKRELVHFKEKLDALNPKTILKKGYCIPFTENKSSVMMSSQNSEVGQLIKLLFHDGEVTARVE